ncbi:MAG: MoaD/ThiS family protein [Spirochaetales bacterium]|nr:MoaD/ThiS family protein [Spirochaetales bacterium]
MTIKIQLFGYYQMMLGRMYLEITLTEPSSLEDLWQHMVSSHRQLKSPDMKAIAGMAVNGRYIKREDWSRFQLTDMDKIDLASQMAGG